MSQGDKERTEDSAAKATGASGKQSSEGGLDSERAPQQTGPEHRLGALALRAVPKPGSGERGCHPLSFQSLWLWALPFGRVSQLLHAGAEAVSLFLRLQPDVRFQKSQRVGGRDGGREEEPCPPEDRSPGRHCPLDGNLGTV